MAGIPPQFRLPERPLLHDSLRHMHPPLQPAERRAIPHHQRDHPAEQQPGRRRSPGGEPQPVALWQDQMPKHDTQPEQRNTRQPQTNRSAGQKTRAPDRAGNGEDQQHQPRPVDPNPPEPRSVASSSSTTSNAACTTGATTSCATRSPCSTAKASAPRFTRITPTSPR